MQPPEPIRNIQVVGGKAEASVFPMKPCDLWGRLDRVYKELGGIIEWLL